MPFKKYNYSALKFLFLILLLLSSDIVFAKESVVDSILEGNEKNISESTSDHRKFEVLKQKFKNGPDVTRACLTCHTEAAKQVHQSIHWKWSWDQGVQKGLGKRYALNNF